MSARRLRAGIARMGSPGGSTPRAVTTLPVDERAAAPITQPIVLVSTGGTVYHPRHYHLLATGLFRAGLQVIVAGQPRRGAANTGDVPVSLLPSSGNRARRFLGAPFAMRHAASLDPALIQINSLDLLPWAVLARRFRRVPVIYDANEDYAAYMLIKEWLPRPLRRPLSRIVGVVEPWLAGRLDAVVVADPGTQERFLHGDRPVVLVYNFPELAFGDVAHDREPTFDITHHGSLPSYTLRNMIATAQELQSRGASPSWRLVTRGDSPAEQHALRTSLTEAGVADSFTLEWGLPFEQMPAVVASTRVGFIPLPDEQKFRHNIPRKLFEFMAAGRPVVASDLPPTRALVGDADCCILVRPGDATGYADAIQSLLDDPARAAEMGRNGRALFLERMHAEDEIGRYVALCETLARRGQSGV